jgi:hypothetical protein
MRSRSPLYLVVLTLGIVLGMSLEAVFRPLASIPAVAQATCHTFEETRQTVCGRFLEYWQTHGGLGQQGYPISPELEEVSQLNFRIHRVQYFERAVFEYHPEFQPPNDVLLAQLGTLEFRRRYPDQAPPPVGLPQATPERSPLPVATQQPTAVSTATKSVPQPTIVPTETPPTPYACPTQRVGGERCGAVCRDGSISTAIGSGACSRQGGVCEWLYVGDPRCPGSVNR